MIRFFSLLLIFFTSLVYGGWFDGLSINSNEEGRVKGVFRKLPATDRYCCRFPQWIGLNTALVGDDLLINISTNKTTKLKPAFDYTPPNGASSSSPRSIMLQDGRVLIVGSYARLYPNGAQLFDPKTETLSRGGDMKYEYYRSVPNLTMLQDGRVVVMQPGKAEDLEERAKKVTEYHRYSLETHIEIYDPKTDSFEKGGRTVIDRGDFVSIKTPDEKILIIGGNGAPRAFGTPKEVELYDPTTKKSKIIGKLLQGKMNPIVQYLPDGKILVMGGYTKEDDRGFPHKPTKIAEIFNLTDGTSERIQDSIWIASKGSVSFAVDDQIVIVSALRAQGFDTKTKSFYKIADMGEDEERMFFEAGILPDNKVLMSGGMFIRPKKRQTQPLDMWLFEVIK